MKIHKEGTKIIIINFIIWAVVAAAFIVLCNNPWVKWIAVAVCAFLALFMFRFFRVPSNPVVKDGDFVFAPSYGEVTAIKEVEENEYFKGRCRRISIYLDFFDIHITWFPVGGKVLYYKYHPGKYFFAWYHKSSEKNEHTSIVVETEHGVPVMFRQIAGIVARRIVCYAEVGKEFEQGSEAGFIKFGSRLDVFLPLDAEILVKKGDKAVGQVTRLARLNRHK